MRRICSFTDFYCVLLDLSAPAGRWDFHGLSLAGGNPAPYRRINNPCSFRHWVFLTRIYRIDADATFVGRYCLPDSSHYMLYKSRDFVPGHSRCARYWLPARSPVLWCPSEQELQLFHINSHISDCFLLKNKMLKCNSTLPPRGSYRFDNQDFIGGGIRGGIRVELREVPP